MSEVDDRIAELVAEAESLHRALEKRENRAAWFGLVCLVAGASLAFYSLPLGIVLLVLALHFDLQSFFSHTLRIMGMYNLALTQSINSTMVRQRPYRSI